MKLNGWQRIWIVISLSWLSYLYVISETYTQTLYSYLNDYFVNENYDGAYKSLEEIIKNDDSTPYGFLLNRGSKLSEIPSYSYSNKKRTIEHTYSLFNSRKNIPKYKKIYEDLKEIKRSTQLEYIKYLVTEVIPWSLAPLIFIYLLGMLVGWIRAGFKGST